MEIDSRPDEPMPLVDVEVEHEDGLVALRLVLEDLDFDPVVVFTPEKARELGEMLFRRSYG